MGPAEEEGIRTMKSKRDVEKGIGGEGVRVGGERERTEKTGKERRTHRIQHSGRCKYDQRAHADMITLMRSQIT